VCSLYGSSATTVSEARYQMFCLNGSTEQNLPPSLDALTQHMRRVCYQTKVWRSATHAHINPPSPAGFGWKIVDGALAVEWLAGCTVPPDVLKLIKCACKKSGCKGPICACTNANLKCTALCTCIDCSNVESCTENKNVSDEDSESDGE
jgi:hypothetical protein